MCYQEHSGAPETNDAAGIFRGITPGVAKNKKVHILVEY
jgi:hypothetical protein